MAHITFNGDAGVLHRIGWAVRDTAAFVGRAIAMNSAAEARFREVTRLQSLSDAELNTLGIDRDRIVHHVFRDIYSI